MSSPDEPDGEPSAEETEGAEGTDGTERTEGSKGAGGTEGTETIDTENVGDFGEIVPEPLQPVWRRVESVQQFRRTHGDTYVTVLEAIVAVVLAGGYLYWLFLYLTG